MPIVISVPQKSLSIDPTKPAIRNERYFCFCSGVIDPATKYLIKTVFYKVSSRTYTNMGNFAIIRNGMLLNGQNGTKLLKFNFPRNEIKYSSLNQNTT